MFKLEEFGAETMRIFSQLIFLGALFFVLSVFWKNRPFQRGNVTSDSTAPLTYNQARV